MTVRNRRIRVGTRASTLALTQTRLVSDWLESHLPGTTVETIQIRTTGDVRANDPIASMAGKGVFVDAIENALLGNEIDFAVHSAKDLPARDAAGLKIAAYPRRADVRDVLVSRNGKPLRDLAAGAVIGTSSRRRSCQVLAIRPDLQTTELRGNVDTRLRRLDEGSHDAIILAAAGLIRLGLEQRVTEWISIEDMMPAPAQGALAVQIREEDSDLADAFKAFNDPETSAAVSCERAFLATLGTGCSAPVGAHATCNGDSLTLRAMVQGPGGEIFREVATASLSESKEMAIVVGTRLKSHLSTE
jgi:hydroxymethylbilane synthase